MSRVGRFVQSNLVGFLALFVAMSTGAYAVTQAPRNSVVSKSIKNGQVKGKDLAGNSVNSTKVPPDGLGGVDVEEATLDSSVLQRRISDGCSEGQAVQAVSSTGSVTCTAAGGAGGAGTVTTVDTGFGLTGGPITSSGTIAVDEAAVQRRVNGACTYSTGVRSIDVAGTVACVPSRIARIHTLVPSANEEYSGAYVLLEMGSFELLGMCHGAIANGSTLITGTKVLLFNNHPSRYDTVNWFYSDGANTYTSGRPIGPDDAVEFNFVNKRIEGQFIYSEGEYASDTTINLHAYDGGSFCEFAGTGVRAAGGLAGQPDSRMSLPANR